LFSFIYGFFVNLLIYSAAHPGHKLLGEVMCDTVCRGVVSDSHVVAHRPTRTLKFDFSDEASSLSGWWWCNVTVQLTCFDFLADFTETAAITRRTISLHDTTNSMLMFWMHRPRTVTSR